MRRPGYPGKRPGGAIVLTGADVDRSHIVSGDDLREAAARRANYEERIRTEVAR